VVAAMPLDEREVVMLINERQLITERPLMYSGLFNHAG
jgi:hypothetical protein